MFKRSFLIYSIIMLIAGCGLRHPAHQVFTPASQVVDKPVLIQPPPMQMNYELSEGNNPALQRAYQQYLKTGKAANIKTEGFIQFAYDTGSQPLIAASPFELTVITLEQNENVTNVSSGDPTRWSYSIAYSGLDKQRQAHILVKPSQPGISTDLVITTDKRLYTLKIVATDDGKYVRDVRFWYPEAMQEIWRNYNAQQVQKVTQTNTVAELPDINISTLNFDYSILSGWLSRGPAWKPTRVFDDGTHTYIQFSQLMASRDMPALFILNGNNKELVNYRAKSPYFIVDKIFHQAVLIVGVGSDQTKVTITNNHYA